AVLSCPPPPAIPHGQHSGNSSGEFVLGSIITYTCEPGLELVGQDTLTCTGDSGDSGSWSGAPPACREVTCPRPPSIANGLLGGQPSARPSRGATVTYSCRQGFELLGNATISCTAAGLWSRPLPRCAGAR
ncbi:CR2 protein, partial [Spelaeornis formosus]|nr:CR2 protein [Elachura formosa]